jgi:serine/threonine protein kinase
MPSRRLQQQLPLPPPAPPPPPLPAKTHQPHRRVLLTATAASATACVLLTLVAVLLLLRRWWRRRPTLPFSPPPAESSSQRPLRRYSRRAIRRATAGFHPSRLLGRGAASPVYLATFPDASLAAVKARASPHELHLLASLPADAPHLVSLLGYFYGSGEKEDRALSLVFEYLPHGSLQSALFGDGCEVVLDWPRRMAVIRDVARALAFLHAECRPPVVHGDLKPSNVLLDADFRGKLADFGLARFKTPDSVAAAAAGDDFMSQELGEEAGDHLSTTTVSAAGGGATNKDESSGPANAWGKEWWWKQDGSRELDARDYVAEWIESQICPERNPDSADDEHKNSPAATDEHAVLAASPEDKKNADGKGNADEAKTKEGGKMREWWKEEFFEEMSKKAGGGSFDNDKHRGKPWPRSISMNTGHVNGDGNVEPSGLDLGSFRRNRKRSRRRGRSADSDVHSAGGGGGDFLSRELSSTTSMRGTVCYVAPECGGGPCGDHGGELLEKADVYSFGVLVLVILSGRRPLHVLSSPMKLERANLVSWCRQLARAGNVLELVDDRLVEGGYDRDQAAMCVHLALLCLQRHPELRPDSTDIVKILDGEMELPPAPVESSPSPRVRPFPRSSRRAKHTADAAE